MAINDLDQFLQRLAGRFQANSTLDFDSIIQYHLSGEGGGDWYMIIRGRQCKIKRGIAEKPDATLDSGVEDFVSMMTGSQEEIGWAFMQGKFNMTGNMMPLWRVLAFLREVQTKSI
jgi:putative sterol carrier protein